MNTQAIKELQANAIVQDKHLIKLDANVEYLVKQFSIITEIEVKQD